MPHNAPSFANPKVNASIAAYINDIERAKSLPELDTHFLRAGAYLKALSDVEAIGADDLAGVTLVVDRLYQEQFRRLGKLGFL